MRSIELMAVTALGQDGTVTEEMSTKFPFGIEDSNGVPGANQPADEAPALVQGRPIVKRLAHSLISRFQATKLQENPDEEDPIVSVTFDRSPLMLLLSQPGCMGIRYYYAMKENGDVTMVLSGVDSEGNDLGIQSCTEGKLGSIVNDQPFMEERAVLLEVGGGNRKSQLDDE